MHEALRRAGRRVGPAALLVLGYLAGCAADRPALGELRGRVLPEPIARPEFTMTDAAGQPYVFGERTAGKLTFLFFGYTYCPDVCPVHMASLAAALGELPWEERQRVEVIFVTVDPERDTPERLREWLGGFDPRFVALRGTLEEANAVAAQVGFPPSAAAAAEDENYSVGHPASVIAFAADGPARVVYPFGTRREDWTHDLPLLLRMAGGAAPAAAEADAPAAVMPAGGVQVTRAFVTRARMPGAAALYAVIENGMSTADALVAVDAPAARIELHETVRSGEGVDMVMRMQPVSEIVVPAGGAARLEPGGHHVMLIEPALDWQPGDTALVRFRFRSGVIRSVAAPVVTHADIVRLLEGGR